MELPFAGRDLELARMPRILSPMARLAFRPATPDDIAECVVLRGRTRENAVPPERLASVGITVESWAEDVRADSLPGYVCTDEGTIAGYCFGDKASGEIVVLALLPAYENQGIGRHLLELMVGHLVALGHQRLYLGCSSDPRTRSHGFYRHLGWRSTGAIDRFGDEVLELFP
jgi:GNAT superfamily N-acetyltransferase